MVCLYFCKVIAFQHIVRLQIYCTTVLRTISGFLGNLNNYLYYLIMSGERSKKISEIFRVSGELDISQMASCHTMFSLFVGDKSTEY